MIQASTTHVEVAGVVRPDGSLVHLLQDGETSTPVVLRATTALLVAVVLASVGSEEPCGKWSQHMKQDWDRKTLTDMLSILARSLHLRVVVRTGERLLTANQLLILAMLSVEQLGTLEKEQKMVEETAYLRTVVFRLQHHRRVSELLNKAVLALNG